MNDFTVLYVIQAANVFVTAGLLITILRKTGYVWLRSMLGLLPLGAGLITMLLIAYGISVPSETFLLSTLIGLLPLLLLAFGKWPRLAARYSPSETFK